MQPTYDKRGGFTVVELLVGISIMTVITIGLVALVVSLVGTASRSIATTKQIQQTQSALNVIKNDLRLTNKFLHTATTPDTDRNGANWRHQGAGTVNQRALLLQVRSTNITSVAENRQPLYRIQYSTLVGYGCVSTSAPSAGNSGEPEYHTVIYYLHESTLYRRVVVTPIVDVSPLLPGMCTGGTLKPVRTCQDPTSPTKPPLCQQKDVALAQNVSEFDILYYSNPADTSANDAATSTGATQAQIDTISTIQVKIKTTKDIGGRDNEFTSKIRANRGNTF